MAKRYSLEEITKKRRESLVDLPNECWLDIEDYEGFYQISNYGRVKSGLRLGKNGRKLSPKILKTSINKNSGQCVVRLNKNGVITSFTLTTLMKKYFPTKEDIEKKTRQKPVHIRGKRIRQYSNYILYNESLNTKEYYKTLEDIYEKYNFPISILERMLMGELLIPNYKIYKKERGVLDSW